MSMIRWSGQNFYAQRTGPTTISVIEPAGKREDPPDAKRVPFGFARAIPQPEPEPLLWEGEGA
jgi:hypothetical protein